jgi:hypothetical protein
MEPAYRHTQIGWVMIAAAAFAIGLARSLSGAPGAAVALGLVVVVLALFSALTVEVDAREVRLRFGIGVPRKTIPLGSISDWRAVRNPWYAGWGIRLGPTGAIWNVSGLDAVELTLADGRRFRAGTDEPQALVDAIARAKALRGEPAQPTAVPPEPGQRSRWPAWALAFALVGLPVLWLFYAQTRPPRVTVDASGFAVQTPFYGQRYAAADVVSVELLQRLPRILARTNGFAGAGSLRGWFQVEGLGKGKLFVDLGFPPYVLVRLRDGSFAILHFHEPERTLLLYEQLRK